MPFLKAYGERHLERKVLRYEIKKILTEAILNGDIGPGDRIIETRIAKDLQVSQAPVREAIRELEQMGLVETQPYKGAFVKVIKEKELFETCKLRMLIESFAAEIVAEKVNSHILDKLAELIERMKQFAETNRRSEFLEVDISFHELIVKFTDNSLLHKIWSMVNMAQLPYAAFSGTEMSFSLIIKQHESIYGAFVEKNPQLAANAVKEHIEELGKKITRNF